MFNKISLMLLFSCISVRAQTQNYYYGNIHSHTSYSDGNKDSATSGLTTPLQDFLYAKQSLHTDFYGISEHNHQSAGNMGPYYFNKGLADADSVTIDGQYVAMYGMEWGVISSGGHVLLYGFDSLCGWDFGNTEIHVAEADYLKLWKTINRKPNCFAYLAHPQTTDYNNLFTTNVSAEADNAIAGMAILSGPAFSTNNTYSNPDNSSLISRYNDALKRGYHLGVGVDHDTHNTVFDRQSAGRLVVMAPILNRQEIINGIRNMRFYASDDWNAKVDFKINNLPMGSIITNSGSPNITLTITDPDGENVSSIKLYYGVPGSGSNPTILTSVSGTNTLNYMHNITDNTNYYYYLIITQTDGNTIWSSPIWYNRNDATVIQNPTANFSNYQTVCAMAPEMMKDSSSTNVTSWWWSNPNGYPTQSSLQNPTFSFSSAGVYNITLTVTNQVGTTSTITKAITVQDAPNMVVIVPDSICLGVSATLSASGCDNYLWSNDSITNSIVVKPGFTKTYFVKGFVGACMVLKNITVNVYQAIALPVITFSNDTLYSSYNSGNQWYKDGSMMVGETSNFLYAPPTAGYRVQVINNAGCTSAFSSPFGYTNTSSLIEIDAEALFNIYPIPALNLLHISSKKLLNNLELSLYDATGRAIISKHFDICSQSNIIDLNLETLPKKLYYFRILVEGKYYATKISVE